MLGKNKYLKWILTLFDYVDIFIVHSFPYEHIEDTLFISTEVKVLTQSFTSERVPVCQTSTTSFAVWMLET